MAKDSVLELVKDPEQEAIKVAGLGMVSDAAAIDAEPKGRYRSRADLRGQAVVEEDLSELKRAEADLPKAIRDASTPKAKAALEESLSNTRERIKEMESRGKSDLDEGLEVLEKWGKREPRPKPAIREPEPSAEELAAAEKPALPSVRRGRIGIYGKTAVAEERPGREDFVEPPPLSRALRPAIPTRPEGGPYDEANRRAREMLAREQIGGTAGELRQRADSDKANQVAAEDFVRNVGTTIRNLPADYKQILGGTMQAAGEFLARAPQDPLTAKFGQDLAKMGADFFDQGQYEIDQSRGMKPGLGAQVVGSAIQSVAQMLPAIAFGYTGGSAVAQTAKVLSWMGAQTGAQSYGQARAQGLEPGQAAVYALIQGTVEAGTELLPLQAWFNGISLPMRKRFLNFLVREVPGEMLATTLQGATDMVSVNPGMTVPQLLDQIFVQTPLSTVLAAGAQAGGMRALEHATGRAGAPAVELPPQQRGPAPAPEPPKPGAAPEGPARFAPTHRMADGTPIAPVMEDGKPVPGAWRTATGDLIELPRAEPLESPKPNAKTVLNGVPYDVEVLGPGRDPNTVRLHDGQEVQVSQLSDMNDEAKARLGLLPEEEKPAAEKPKEPTPAPEKPSTPPPTLESTRALQRQKRLREGVTSVEQMNRIANAPDYERLSFSKAPETGAPLVSIAGDAAVIPERQIGRESVVVIGGVRMPVRYAVVDASTVLASHKVDGTENKAYFGDAIVGEVRALNNGRAAGIQESFNRGTSSPYVAAMAADIDHGVPEQVIRSMGRPMLVRVYPDRFNIEIPNIAEASQGETLQQNPLEHALADAAKLSNVEDFKPDESGNVLAASNLPFVNRFLQTIVPEAERGRYYDQNKKPNKAAADRIEAAVFQKAYGSKDLTSMFAEQADPEIRAVLSALSIAAPDMAKLEGTLKETDLRPYVAEAAKLMLMAKRAGMRLDAYLQQPELIARNPDVEETARMMQQWLRAPKKMADILAEGARFALWVYQDSRTGDLLGDAPEWNIGHVRAKMVEYMEQHYGEKKPGPPDLLGGPAEPGPAPKTPPPAPKSPDKGGAVGPGEEGGGPGPAGGPISPAEGPNGPIRSEARPEVKPKETEHATETGKKRGSAQPEREGNAPQVQGERGDREHPPEEHGARPGDRERGGLPEGEGIRPGREGEPGTPVPAPEREAGPELHPEAPETSLTTPEARREEARSEVDPNPSKEEIEAGNAKKGHLNYQGMRITIETAKGGIRRALDGSWENTLTHDYGYIVGTEDRTGEQIDVFLGPNLDSDKVFIIEQEYQESGRFDEPKVMIGFDDQEQAVKGYLGNYPQDWKAGDVVAMGLEEFKNWLAHGDTTKRPSAASLDELVPGIPDFMRADAEAMHKAYKDGDVDEEDWLAFLNELRVTIAYERAGPLEAKQDEVPYGRPPIKVMGGLGMPDARELIHGSDYNNVPDEHQVFAVNLALTRFELGGRGFMLSDGTGVGKTVEELIIADQVLKRTGKPVLVVTQNKQIFQNNYTDDAELLGVDLSEFELATYVDLRLGKAGKGDYSLVVFDECFPAGTLVSTPHGAKPIESVQRGEAVSTPFGPRLVTNVWKRQGRKALVKVIHERGSFRSTGNHNIYSAGVGFRRTDRLQSSDFLVYDRVNGTQPENLRSVPTAVHSGGQEHHVAKAQAVLLQKLRHEGAVEFEDIPAGNVAEVAWPQAKTGPIIGEKNENSQPDVRPGKPREGLSRPAYERPQSASSWRQWAWIKHGAVHPLSALAKWLGSGIRDFCESLLALAFADGGFGNAVREASCGMRWTITSGAQGQRPRSEKGRIAAPDGLEGFTVLQRGYLGEHEARSLGYSTSRCISVIPDCEVEVTYDLEVDDAHCYFADGVLVSNSHNMKNMQSDQAMAGKRINADHRLFATATPMDKPVAAAYFMSAITGMPPGLIQQQLGFRVEVRMNFRGEETDIPILLPGYSWPDVLDNIVAMRDRAIRAGAMIRREYPFYGKISDESMPWNGDLQRLQQKILDYWDRKIAWAISHGRRTLAMNWSGQKTLESKRWLESTKAAWVFERAMEELDAGRSVVIMSENYSASQIKGLDNETIWGIIQQLEERFRKIQVPYSLVTGKTKKAEEVKKFQSGMTRVLIATPQSGGAGINLDDQVGNKPRTLFVSSPNFSGDIYDQMVGRVSRRNTKSPAKVVFAFYGTQSFADSRGLSILRRKIQALRRIQAGEDADRALGFDFGEEESPTQGEKARPTDRYITDSPIVEYVTKKGKLLRGVVARDLTREQAQVFDPYTFTYDGGFFIREQYIARPAEGGDELEQEPAVSEFPGSIEGKYQKLVAPGVGEFLTGNVVTHDAVRTFEVPGVNAHNAANAAEMVAHLSDEPQENFVALVTDWKHKPIAIVRLALGRIEGTGHMNPFINVGTVLNIPNAKHVWFAHNHPSASADSATMSQADRAVYQNLRTFFKETPVQYMGGLSVSGSRFTAVVPGKELEDNEVKRIPSHEKATTSLPMVERRFSSRAEMLPSITSQEKMFEVIDALSDGKDGLMLLDTRNAPLGFLPLSTSEMSAVRLAPGAEDSVAAKIMRALSIANANRIVVVGGSEDSFQNVSAFLRHLGVTVVNVTPGQTSATSAMQNPPGYYRAIAEASEAAGITIRDTEDHLRSFDLGRRTAAITRIASRPADLPQHVLASMENDGVDPNEVGALYDPIEGHIWYVASNLHSREEVELRAAHEAIGHYGIESILGPDFLETMQEVYESRAAQIQREARTGFLTEYGFDFRNPLHRQIAAAEFIAHKAEAGEEQTLWQKAVAAIRAALRRLGMIREWTDNDILRLLKLSRQSLIDGGVRTANGVPMYSAASREMLHAPISPQGISVPMNVSGDRYLNGKLDVNALEARQEPAALHSLDIDSALSRLASTKPSVIREVRRQRYALNSGINTTYGVRDGRLLGMARRARAGGTWEVYLATSPNETLFQKGHARRQQVGSLNEVERLFNRAGLELRITKPPQIPIPNVSIFDQDWTAPRADTLFKRAVIYLQNRLLLPERYEDLIGAEVGTVPEEAKAHREARLAHARAAGRMADFDHDYTDRVLEIMQRSRLTLREVGLYRYAQHAEERNLAIEAINPTNASGSGMTTERANELLAEMNAGSNGESLRAIAGILDEVDAFRLQLMKDAGLATAESVELLKKYEHYAPLKEIADDDYANTPVGGGYKVGRQFMSAFGRFTEANAEYILPGMIAQAKGTIAAAENAEVLRALLRLVEYAPNPEVWRIQRVSWKPYLDKDTGEVRYAPRPVELDRNLQGRVISVPVDGKRVMVVVADEDLARAYNTSGLQAGEFSAMIGSITRFYALLATAANPEFVLTNLARDFQMAMIRLTGEFDPKLAALVAKDVIPAFWGALMGLRAKGQLPADAGTWHRWYRRYIEAGGQIAYRGMADAETQHEDLLSLLADRGIFPDEMGRLQAIRLYTRRGLNLVGLAQAGRVIVDVNGGVENALRLATFKNLIERGMNEKDAAMAARTITVDFNLKGEASTRIGQLFMFFGANVQGLTTVFRSVANNRSVQALSIALFMMGLGFDLWNRRHAVVGKDGRTAYDNIGQSIKERNLVLMGPDGEAAITSPLPWGFNVFFVAGQLLGSVLDGPVKPLEAAGSMFVATVNQINALGQTPQSWVGSLQLLSPTISDPAIQAITNRSWTDRPIYPERPKSAPPQAKAETYFSGTPDAYVQVAQWLNEVSGGNDVRSGFLDIHPNMLQHWVRTTLGSAGAFYARAFEAVHGKASGAETEAKDIPFLRRFYYEPKDYELSRRFYENLNSAEVAALEVTQSAKRGHPEVARRYAENFRQERSLYPEALEAERAIGRIRKDISDVRRDDRLHPEQKKKRIEQAEQRTRQIMMEFNRRFEAATR